MARQWNTGLDSLTFEGAAHTRFLESRGVATGFVLDRHLEDATLTLISDRHFCESVVLPLHQMSAHIERAIARLSSKYGVDPLTLIHDTQPYDTEIGAAIDALKEDEKSVEFAKEEFIPQKHIKKLRRLYTKAFSFLALFFALFSTLIHVLESRQLKALERELERAKQGPLFTQRFSDIKPSLAQFEERLSKLPQFYDNRAISFSVTRLIDWLGNNISCDIFSLDYELIEYPQPLSPKKKYRAKVILRVTGPFDIAPFKKEFKQVEVRDGQEFSEIHFILS